MHQCKHSSGCLNKSHPALLVSAFLVLPAVVTSTGNGVDAQLLNLFNTARRQNGLSALILNSKLTAAAQAHSVDQANMQVNTHSGSDGSTVYTRVVTRAGYPSYILALGDNVAFGANSAQGAFNIWMNSQGHRDNILGDNIHVGAGAATATNGVMYWTADFAKPGVY
jgi:uncharacterized protein YkwD